MKRILIIEDDKAIADLEGDYLRAAGFEVEIQTDGLRGLEAALADGFSLVLVDLMLPGLTGMEICQKIREVSEVPLVVVSALSSDLDKVRVLGLGADDFVTKL